MDAGLVKITDAHIKSQKIKCVSFLYPFLTPFMVRSHLTYIKLWSFAPDNDLVSGVSSLLTCSNLPSFPNTPSVPVSPLMGCLSHLCQPPFIHKDKALSTSPCSRCGSLFSEPLWLLQSAARTVRPYQSLLDFFLDLASVTKQWAPCLPSLLPVSKGFMNPHLKLINSARSKGRHPPSSFSTSFPFRDGAETESQ